MTTDRESAVLGLANTLGMVPTISNVNEAVKAMQRRTVKLQKLTADPAAADATANGVCNGTFAVHTSLFRKSKLVAARLYCTTDTNVTAHDTNYATINVTKCNGAGGANTVILSNTTKITGGLGNIAKQSLGTPTSMTASIVSNAAECAADSHLMIQIAKAASGVAVQPFILELDFEEI